MSYLDDYLQGYNPQDYGTWSGQRQALSQQINGDTGQATYGTYSDGPGGVLQWDPYTGDPSKIKMDMVEGGGDQGGASPSYYTMGDQQRTDPGYLWAQKNGLTQVLQALEYSQKTGQPLPQQLSSWLANQAGGANPVDQWSNMVASMQDKQAHASDMFGINGLDAGTWQGPLMIGAGIAGGALGAGGVSPDAAATAGSEVGGSTALQGVSSFDPGMGDFLGLGNAADTQAVAAANGISPAAAAPAASQGGGLLDWLSHPSTPQQFEGASSSSPMQFPDAGQPTAGGSSAGLTNSPVGDVTPPIGGTGTGSVSGGPVADTGSMDQFGSMNSPTSDQTIFGGDAQNPMGTGTPDFNTMDMGTGYDPGATSAYNQTTVPDATPTNTMDTAGSTSVPTANGGTGGGGTIFGGTNTNPMPDTSLFGNALPDWLKNVIGNPQLTSILGTTGLNALINGVLSNKSQQSAQDFLQSTNPLNQTQRQPYQQASLDMVQNPQNYMQNNPFAVALTNQFRDNVIPRQVAQSGNAANVIDRAGSQFATAIGQNYNSLLNTLSGYGGFTQGNPGTQAAGALTAQGNQQFGEIFRGVGDAATRIFGTPSQPKTPTPDASTGSYSVIQ